MKKPVIAVLLCFTLLSVLVGCGGGTKTLTDFQPITKTEGDDAFMISPPSSVNPNAFTYTSSDSKVATVSGSTITILTAGTTTITATQEGKGSFIPTVATTLLTVLPITCKAPAIRQNSKCIDFPPITKTEGEDPFTLTPPSLLNPGPFTYTISDPTIATISGSTVTILLAGTATITATQDAQGSFTATNATALLTVLPITCKAPATRQNGKCVMPIVCTAPATSQNGACIAPAAVGSFVLQKGRSFMPVIGIDTWSHADAYCSSTVIDGLTGWRLPLPLELTELTARGAANGQGWMALSQTWTSAPSNATALAHVTVDLNSGASNDTFDSDGAFITCVH